MKRARFLPASDPFFDAGPGGVATEVGPLWSPNPGSPQERALASTADVIGFGGQAGGGKALALDTPIPTPSGWATMGSLAMGDAVFDDRGKPCRVVAVSDIFTDHDCYRVEFDDGEAIVADAGHRWFTTTDKERDRLLRSSDDWKARRRSRWPSRGTGKRPDLAARNAAVALARPPAASALGAIRTTVEIAGSVEARPGRSNHAVAVARAIDCPAVPLPVPPYTLGAWLGDGKTTAGKVYIQDSDLEIVRRIEGEGFTSRDVPSEPIGRTILGLQSLLRSAGLLGDKHIPPAYQRASAAARIELLRGLMDTDGTCDDDGGADFTTTLPALAVGILELARGLGIKAALTEGRATLYGMDCGPKYRVKMTTAIRVFNLPRKFGRQPASVRPTQRTRYIIRCERTATVPVRCIAVDSPSHLFLAGRAMVPTHNSDVLLGKALMQFRKAIIFRRLHPLLTDLIERSREIVGGRGRFAGGHANRWRLDDGRTLEFGAVQYEEDREKFRGRPHDYIGIDEATEFPESIFRFLLGWLRTTDPAQKCQAMLTFNPPTTKEGEWVIRYFAPWIDRKHPHPAADGELRWYATIAGEDREVDGPGPVEFDGERIEPTSRTFFRSRLADNPHLARTNYGRQLMSLPEPLKSQLLYGDFNAGLAADPWQVIPAAWVEAAMARWREDGGKSAQDCVGLDVAHGGADKTVAAPRHGFWFGRLHKVEGARTPDGKSAAAEAMRVIEPGAYANVDAIGYGASCAERLIDQPPDGHGVHAYAVNVADRSTYTDRSGRFRCVNLRDEMYWRMRDALDPEGPQAGLVALPPDRELLAELAEPKYELTAQGIKVEPKKAVAARLGRSPDAADAACLALLPPPPKARPAAAGGARAKVETR